MYLGGYQSLCFRVAFAGATTVTMNFAWLKRYVPRGIYGRAALILLVPILTLQIAVSVIFIQRHFEDVTQQMTRSLALDLRFMLEEIKSSTEVFLGHGLISA
jgi:two-component system osmolarity sensor histidine kinase EnvZ